MAIGINQGDSVQFTVEFQDGSGNPTVPSSGAMTLVYTSSSQGQVSATIGLINAGNGIFTGSWNSGVASYGPVSYTITAPGQPNSTGQFQIVTP